MAMNKEQYQCEFFIHFPLSTTCNLYKFCTVFHEQIGSLGQSSTFRPFLVCVEIMGYLCANSDSFPLNLMITPDVLI